MAELALRYYRHYKGKELLFHNMNAIASNYLVASYPNRGITFESGEGIYLLDLTGKRYMDLGSNYGVNIFGYHHPQILTMLLDQMSKLINLHGSFTNEMRSEASQKLVKKCGGKLSKVFFSNSGAEAIEAALKFARLFSGKSHFIAMDHGYHGKTLGALSATAGDKYRDPFLPLLWKFSHVPFGDIQAIEKSITKDTAGILVEPVSGEGGILVPLSGYLSKLQALCDRHNILLIVDEIQTGLGRTGTFLAGEQSGLTPDILCLGKGLAGGIPIGATLTSEEIATKIPLHIHTSTFGGNPLACSGIVAVLNEFDDGKLLIHVKDVGQYFLCELQKIKHPKIKEIRGSGLMIGIELTENATTILKSLQNEHIIAIPAGSNVVRFLPPYLITKKEINKVLSVLNTIFQN